MVAGKGRGRGRPKGKKTKATWARRAKEQLPVPKFTPGETLELLNANGDVVGRGCIFAHSDGTLPGKLHGYSVRELCQQAARGEKYTVVRVYSVSPDHANDKYPYHMKGAEVPDHLKDMYKMNNYIWDIHRLRKVAQETALRKEPKDKNQEPTDQARKPKLTAEPKAVPGPSAAGSKAPMQMSESAPVTAPKLRSVPPPPKTARKQPPTSPTKQAPIHPKPSPTATSMEAKKTVPSPKSATTATAITTKLVVPTTPTVTEKEKQTSSPTANTIAAKSVVSATATAKPTAIKQSPSPEATAAVGKQAAAPPLRPTFSKMSPPTIPTPTPTQNMQKPQPGNQSPTSDLPPSKSVPTPSQTSKSQKETEEKPESTCEDRPPDPMHVDNGLPPTVATPPSQVTVPVPPPFSPPNAVQDHSELQRNDSVTATDAISSVARREEDDRNCTDEEPDKLPSTVDDEALLVGDDDDDNEGEGDEIKVPDTRGRDTYRRKRIRVRIDQLVYPPNLTRDLDRDHVGKLKTSLRGGIDYSLGYISVAYKPSTKQYTPVRYRDEKFKDVDVDEKPAERSLQGKEVLCLKAYFVINGMHRGTAIDRIFKDIIRLKDRKEYGVIDVILYERLDGKEMSFYEIIALGGNANDTGTISKAPCFADQIRLSVSCVKEILEMNPDIHMTGAGLGRLFFEQSIIRSSSKETCRKYARLALTFARRPVLYEHFQDLWNRDKKGKKFRVSHFQTAIFHTMFSEKEQLIILDSLYDFIRQTTNTYFTSPAAKAFFTECRNLLDIIGVIADKKEVSVEDILDELVPVTKTQKVSILTCFMRTVTRFNPTEKPHLMSKRSRTRVDKFKTNVMEHFFPKTEEDIKREADEQKRLEEEKLKDAAKRAHLARIAKTTAIAATSDIAVKMNSMAGKATGKRKRLAANTASAKIAKKSTRDSPLPRFDDSVPIRYPAKYSTRPSKWNGLREWVQLLEIPPHRIWDKDLYVWGAEPWLHGMGVPRKHRAHLFLTANDLERNHHCVYYHAALQAAFKPSIATNQLYDSARKRTEDPLTRAVRIAKQYPELCQEYLASCRERVMNMGFCVVEGIFDDSLIAAGPIKTIYDENPASRVVEYYVSRFPTEEEIRKKGSKNNFWEPTFNAFEDVQGTGQGRFVTSNAGLYAHTESDEATVEIAKCRAALEVRALQLCVAMGLEETGLGMLAIPCTGCRLFATTANAERQIPHTDFNSQAGLREGLSPCSSVDFSVIWTADDAVPIILWEYSHVLQSGTSAAARKNAQNAQARRVMIPPFSCVIIRGDLVYAAPGWQDQTLSEKEAMKFPQPVQFHMYVCRWGMHNNERHKRVTDAPVVPETVRFIEKFQPSLQRNPSWISKPPESRK